MCSHSTPPLARASLDSLGDEQAEEGHCARRRWQGQADAKRWQRDGRGSQALPCSGAGRTEEEEGCCS